MRSLPHLLPQPQESPILRGDRAGLEEERPAGTKWWQLGEVWHLRKGEQIEQQYPEGDVFLFPRFAKLIMVLTI